MYTPKTLTQTQHFKINVPNGKGNRFQPPFCVAFLFCKLFGSFQLRGQVGVASSTATNPNKNDTTQTKTMPSRRQLESSKIQSLNKLKSIKLPSCTVCILPHSVEFLICPDARLKPQGLGSSYLQRGVWISFVLRGFRMSIHLMFHVFAAFLVASF